ncbi:MAG: 2-dehydropantoate 2-reductase [Pseudomonadota bacterium]
MSVVIWGAGAIGGTIGAYLIRAGHDVLFVDTDAHHVSAINQNGLTIEGPIDTFTVPACAQIPQTVSGPFDAVWLATKAQHTRSATGMIAPHLSPTGHILSLQNGLTELIVAERIGRDRTLGAFINFGADYLEPGRILYGGRGACVVGELDGAMTARLATTHSLLQTFDDDAIATPNIFGYTWGKLGYGALLFATALTNDSIADCLDREEDRPMLTALAREICSVAAAEGVTPLGFNGYEPSAFLPGADPGATAASFDAMVTHNAKSAKTHSGIWRDLAVRHRLTEVSPILTKPVAIGRRHSIPMPLTQRLIAMIKEIEEGERPMGTDNMSELRTLHQANRS